MIKVRGGVMYANQMGTVDMMCKDGSSLLLKDVLYVPGLGINLLSARRVCQAGLYGVFTNTKMYFMNKEKEKIISAKMSDGLYIVTHVAAGYKEKAFASFEALPEPGSLNTHGLALATTEILPEPGSANVTSTKELYIDSLTQKDKDLYKLMHRRLNHLGLEKIRTLHKVTTLSHPIKIPRSKEMCEVCKLTKMRNQIPKTLSPHKEFKLALIQFDVAGPFPPSIRGNRYFMLIIDNWARKEWTLCMAYKSDAPRALREWKAETESRANSKIKAARSDNAPELLQAIKEWNNEGSGVRVESTTIASSHQNGPAERNIQTAEADMRAMLKDADLPMEFWDEAVEHDTHVRNLTATGPTIDGSIVSPEEAFEGETPSIDRLRV